MKRIFIVLMIVLIVAVAAYIPEEGPGRPELPTPERYAPQASYPTRTSTPTGYPAPVEPTPIPNSYPAPAEPTPIPNSYPAPAEPTTIPNSYPAPVDPKPNSYPAPVTPEPTPTPP